MIKKLVLLIPFAFLSCIGEDIIQDEINPEVRFLNPVYSLEIGTSLQFDFSISDNVGMQAEPTEVVWQSSNEAILTINESGLATAHDYGNVVVFLTATIEETEVGGEMSFSVADETVFAVGRSGTIKTTSSYILSGEFEIYQQDDKLIIEFFDDYVADDGLPGLYVYLTNNPSTSANAYEIGEVTKFSGAHSYEISDVSLFEYSHLLYYCKPFNVKVGDGEIMDQ